MGRIFGTDGARGVAVTELTCERALEIGRAAAYVLTKESGKAHPNIIVGMDTRISSKSWRRRCPLVLLPWEQTRCCLELCLLLRWLIL